MTGRPALWAVAQQIGKQGVQYLVFAVLAVLLSPQAFGVVATAMIWIAFMLVFSELGFGAALIQRATITPQHLSSVFLLNLAVGALLAGFGWLSSYPFAWLMRVPEAQPVVAVLSLAFVSDAFSLTQIAVAQRELRFRTLAIRDIGAALIGGSVGVALALRGAGAWSLVAQTLVTSLCEAALLWGMSPWRPRLREWSWAALRELWGYSASIFGFNLFKFFAQTGDRLVVGALLGPLALGLYTFAYRIVVQPVLMLVGAYGNYLFPRIARLQDDAPRIRGVFLETLRMTSAAVTPAMALLALIAPVAVPLLFGAQWVGAVPAVQILAGVAVLQALISPSGQLMKALDRTRWLLWWSVAITAITASCMWASSRGGIVGVSLGLLVAYLVGLPIIAWINWRLIGVTLLASARSLWPSFAATLVVGALFSGILRSALPSDALRSSLALALSVPTYAVILGLIDRSFVLRLLKGQMRI